MRDNIVDTRPVHRPVHRLDVRYAAGMVKIQWADGSGGAVLTPEQAREFAGLMVAAACAAEKGGGNPS